MIARADLCRPQSYGTATPTLAGTPLSCKIQTLTIPLSVSPRCPLHPHGPGPAVSLSRRFSACSFLPLAHGILEFLRHSVLSRIFRALMLLSILLNFFGFYILLIFVCGGATHRWAAHWDMSLWFTVCTLTIFLPLFLRRALRLGNCGWMQIALHLQFESSWSGRRKKEFVWMLSIPTRFILFISYGHLLSQPNPTLLPCSEI